MLRTRNYVNRRDSKPPAQTVFSSEYLLYCIGLDKYSSTGSGIWHALIRSRLTNKKSTLL